MNLLEVDFEKLHKILGTDLEKGLSVEQVIQNREEFGENILFQKNKSIKNMIRHIFSDIMVVVLFLVALVSILQNGLTVESFSALFAILFVVLFATVSYIMSHRANKIVKKYSNETYRVKRSGKIIRIDKSEIVSGDLIVLEKGDVMPCDGIILKQKTLRILEANVTGRRTPIIKRTYGEVHESDEYPYFECVLFAGSVVLLGSATVFVCNTGKNIFDSKNFTVSRQNTFMPKIYEKAIYLKKQISLIWILLCFLLFCLGIYFGQQFFSMFMFSSLLVVSAFPDSIQYLSDISLSYMTIKLFDLGIVLRNPGCIDSLCDVNTVFINSADFLYYSKPHAGYFSLGNTIYNFKETPRLSSKLIEALILTENSSELKDKGIKNNLLNENAAINTAALKAGIIKKKLEKQYMYISRYDYDKEYGFSCSLVMKDEKYKLIVRGNPSFIIPLCSEQYFAEGNSLMNDSAIKNINSSYRSLAGQCEKIYAVAVKDIDSPSTEDQRTLCNDMIFLGMFGLYTPISAESANAINICQKSGIGSYLMTNDYPETVFSLSKSVSVIGDDDYQGALSYSAYSRMDKGIFIADIERYKAFCEFPPEDKQNIVKFHKDEGNITLSITNSLFDSLPQMESDVSFTDTTSKNNSVKLNSDVILRKKNYSLIPSAINWVRTYYKNIVHIMQYILTVQFAFIFTTFIGLTTESILIFNPLYLVIIGFMVSLPASLNIALNKAGKKLETNVDSLKDRINSVSVLLIVPAFIGLILSLVTAISFEMVYFSTNSYICGANSAFLTFSNAMFLISISMKSEEMFFTNIKDNEKIHIITFVVTLFVNIFVVFTPVISSLISGSNYYPPNFMYILSFVISFVPFLIREGMKLINIKSKTAASKQTMKGE